MLTYEITLDSGTGLARCATRKREDAARLVLQRFVYDACEAQGLRDRAVAHRHMNAARTWTRATMFAAWPIGSYQITISAEKMP